ncbi:MAG TPA: hypothetical protein VLM89_11920, partial [Phycisphaerae bacterium]|nr:hypothetical protein [Phycisphaerae bacterium]
MKTGQFSTPAHIAQQTNIRFDGVLELIDRLKVEPAFTLNGTGYYDAAAVRKIDAAAAAADRGAAASGKMIHAAAAPAIVPLTATAEIAIEAAADGKPAK